jgi:hypothetical protein
VNATAISYTIDQAFAALEALKAIKPKHDAISSERGGFVFCPDAQVSAAYVAAGRRLFEVANYFYATSTGFKTLNECLDAQGHGYRPTFREDGGRDRETVFLAEVYDLIAECRGLALRAYRPEQAKPEPATYQRVRDLDGTAGLVYEVRIDGDYVAHFKRLADVKRAYPNAVKRGDD